MSGLTLGSNGDDIFVLGAESESIHGKKGFDLAIFHELFEDFIVSLKGTGNDKATVTDVDDGFTYDFKAVEMILFDGGTPGLDDDVYFNTALGTTMRPVASVDAAGQESPGEIFPGSGIPSDGFVVVNNASAGVELGLQVIYRQGPTVAPVSVDPDGTVHFEVNDGAQSTANGSSANNAGRAAWSFDYSFVTGLDGATTDLGDFTFKMMVDVDPTEGTSFREFTMVDSGAFANDTGFVWVDETGTPVIGDDGGNGNVAQNSENFAFGFIEDFIDADPEADGIQPYAPAFGPAQFDIAIEAYDADGDLVAQNQIVVDVIDFA